MLTKKIEIPKFKEIKVEGLTEVGYSNSFITHLKRKIHSLAGRTLKFNGVGANSMRCVVRVSKEANPTTFRFYLSEMENLIKTGTFKAVRRSGKNNTSPNYQRDVKKNLRALNGSGKNRLDEKVMELSKIHRARIQKVEAEYHEKISKLNQRFKKALVNLT